MNGMTMKPTDEIEPKGADTIDNLGADLLSAIDDFEKARDARHRARAQLEACEFEVDRASEVVNSLRGRLHDEIERTVDRSFSDGMKSVPAMGMADEAPCCARH